LCQRKHVSLFSTIQDMKFFLHTGFGNSKDYACSTGGIKMQGMCQGNSAAPARWIVDSIPMIQAHKLKGHGVHLICPISGKTLHIARTLFGSNTDLEHFSMNKSETVWESHAALQASILYWGSLLIATGAALKPEKASII
jgi:hypothetical protein